MPKRKVRIVEQAVKASRSPTQSSDPESGMGLTDTLADEKTPSPDEAILSESEHEWLSSLINQLNDREAKILRLRYGLDDGREKMNLKEIGKAINQGESAVCYHIRHGLEKIKKVLNRKMKEGNIDEPTFLLQM